MLRFNTIRRYVSLLISVCLVSGCSTLRAGPAEDSGFLGEPEKMSEQSERYPFNAVWVSEGYKSTKATYDKIIVRPVDTSYLLKTGDWHHIKSQPRDRIIQDAQGIAADIEQSIKDSFGEEVSGQINLTEDAGPRTLILETALVELVPTDLARNAAGDILGFYVLGGSLLSAGSGGSTAIEGRFLDAETNDVLWMFKDREVDQIAPIDLAGLTPYRHIENTIDDWANEIVELLNTPMDHKVTHKLPFTLLPW